MPLTLHQARAGGRALALGIITFGMLGAQAAHARLSPPSARPELFQRYMRRWARALLHAFGCELRVHGHVPARRPERGRLVVANHRSPLDIAILLELFGGCALSRADLASWPVLGMAAREAGTIFVDREDASSGASAIRSIRACLKSGNSVLVFPEGGTHVGDDVKPFRAGAFAALKGLDVDIVPVGLAYDSGVEFVEATFAAHLARVAGRPRTRCAVRIGQAEVPGARAQATADRLKDCVQALVHGARQDWQHWQDGQ